LPNSLGWELGRYRIGGGRKKEKENENERKGRREQDGVSMEVSL
jgi:hypothetical protein